MKVGKREKGEREGKGGRREGEGKRGREGFVPIRLM